MHMHMFNFVVNVSLQCMHMHNCIYFSLADTFFGHETVYPGVYTSTGDFSLFQLILSINAEHQLPEILIIIIILKFRR